MLKLDPAERASIPEVLNHIWMRQAMSQHHLDSCQLPPHLVGSVHTTTLTNSPVASSPLTIPNPSTPMAGQGSKVMAFICEYINVCTFIKFNSFRRILDMVF